jgi:hypothetical protein
VPSFILNIDVPNIDVGVAFYTAAFDLEVGRRFDSHFVELLGAETNLYLLEKLSGTGLALVPSDAFQAAAAER